MMRNARHARDWSGARGMLSVASLRAVGHPIRDLSYNLCVRRRRLATSQATAT